MSKYRCFLFFGGGIQTPHWEPLIYRRVKKQSLSLQEGKCGYIIILMALYWCTECIPLAVTALMPVILFPMMGIMESGEVCPAPILFTHILIDYSLDQGVIFSILHELFSLISRFVSSTWKTPTCFLLVGCWWPLLLSSGTCTRGSPFKFCSLWE